MILFRRILLWFFIIVLVALAVLAVYLQFNGKQLAEESLSRVFKRPVRIRQANFLPPLGLGLSDCTIEGVLQAKAVNIHLQLPIVFNQQLWVSRLELIDPLIFVARDKEAQFVLQPQTQAPAAPAAGPSGGTAPSNQKSAVQGFYIRHLEINNGKIQYTDQSLEKNYNIRLENLVLKATEVSYPVRPIKSLFHFMVVILGDDIAFSGSKITGDGWVDLGKKDMNGNVQALQPDDERWLSVNLVSKNNDMTVEGKIDINQVINTNHDKEDISLQDFVFGALRSSGLQVGLGFTFKTKMDAFKVDSVSLAGEVRQEETQGETVTLEENLKKIEKQLESLAAPEVQPNINAVAATPEDSDNAPTEGNVAE